MTWSWIDVLWRWNQQFCDGLDVGNEGWDDTKVLAWSWGRVELTFAEMRKTAGRTGLLDGNQGSRFWTCEVWDAQETSQLWSWNKEQEFRWNSGLEDIASWETSANRWYLNPDTEWDHLGVSYPMFESQVRNRQPWALCWADHLCGEGSSCYRAWKRSKHLHARSSFHQTSQNGSGKSQHMCTDRKGGISPKTDRSWFKQERLDSRGSQLAAALPALLYRFQGCCVLNRNCIPVQES